MVTGLDFDLPPSLLGTRVARALLAHSLSVSPVHATTVRYYAFKYVNVRVSEHQSWVLTRYMLAATVVYF